MRRPPPELVEFLHSYSPAVQSIAIGLRSVVLDELAPCHEYIFRMRARAVLLYGPTERVIKDAICLIVVFAKHVNLGFMRGAQLPDRARVLKGSGKKMRHVSLKRLSDLDRPELRVLLRQARRRSKGSRAGAGALDDVVTRVKRSDGHEAFQTTGWPR
jgi:hypothetical protein